MDTKPLFKFAAKQEVRWPVTIHVPLDGGVTRQIKVKAIFEVIDTDQQNAIYAAEGNDTDLMRRVLKGWDDMPGSDDQPVQFSPEAFDEAMNTPYVRAAFVEAYINASIGKTAARKN